VAHRAIDCTAFPAIFEELGEIFVEIVDVAKYTNPALIFDEVFFKPFVAGRLNTIDSQLTGSLAFGTTSR